MALIAQMANELRDLAIRLHNHQSLRGRITGVILDPLKQPQRPEMSDPFPPGHLGDWCLQMKAENEALTNEMATLKAQYREVQAENDRLHTRLAEIERGYAMNLVRYGAPLVDPYTHDEIEAELYSPGDN